MNIKYGGNYGSTVILAERSREAGRRRVAVRVRHREYVTEAGTMNIFFLWTNTRGEGTRHPDARRRYDLPWGHEAA